MRPDLTHERPITGNSVGADRPLGARESRPPRPRSKHYDSNSYDTNSLKTNNYTLMSSTEQPTFVATRGDANAVDPRSGTPGTRLGVTCEITPCGAVGRYACSSMVFCRWTGVSNNDRVAHDEQIVRPFTTRRCRHETTSSDSRRRSIATASPRLPARRTASTGSQRKRPATSGSGVYVGSPDGHPRVLFSATTPVCDANGHLLYGCDGSCSIFTVLRRYALEGLWKRANSRP